MKLNLFYIKYFTNILFLNLFIIYSANAGKNIVSFKAKSLKKYEKDFKNINHLIGEVEFRKEGLVITADEAEYEEQKKIIAKGNIIITRKRNDGTTIIIHSDSLIYHVDKEIAEFHDNLTLSDGKNTLKSDKGEYNDANDTAVFVGNVEVTNKDQVLNSEVFSLDNISKEVLKKHSEIFKDLNIDLNSNKKIYSAEGSVQIYIKKDKITLKSDNCIYFEEEERLKLFGKPILKKTIKNDDYYLYSKNIIIKKDEKSNNKEDKTLLAIDDVHLFNKEFKAKSNEIIYTPSDSIVKFGKNSIFWTPDSQLTANQAKLIMKNENLKEMHLNNDALVIQKDDFNNFNQIQGQKIRMFFKQNKVYLMTVEKEAQSIQFLSDEKKGGLLGVNHIKCNTINIRIKNNKAKKVSFLGKTYADKIGGLMVAPKQATPQTMYFREFNWKPEEKPTFEQVENLFIARDSSSKNQEPISNTDFQTTNT